MGLIPFMIGFGFCFINSFLLDTMSFLDNLIFYSFLFWPTYLIGMILIILAIILKIKKRKKL